MGGTDDCTLPWDEARDAMRHVFAPRGASCILLEGAGHGLCLEDAEQVAQLAFAWCRDVPDPSWWHCLASWRLDNGAGHGYAPNMQDHQGKIGINSDAIMPPPATAA